MVIDFHTHCFHDKIAENALSVLQHNAQRESAIGPKLKDLFASMKAGNVEKAVVLNIATNLKQTKNVNDFAISLLQYPNLIPFGSVHPADENFMTELQRLKAHGIKGIKFHPHYQQTYICDPNYIKIVKVAKEMGFLISFHAGVDIGLRAVNYATPKDTETMLNAVADTPGGAIILAHMGGYEEFDEVEQRLLGRDVYLDTSFVFEAISETQLVRMIRAHGVERILFGTDSPWVQMQDYVARIQALPLSEGEKQQILYENAERLLAFIK